MADIKILFIIFALLYILEYKSINLLAYYVGMVIIIAIVISNYQEINNNIFIILDRIYEQEWLYSSYKEIYKNISFKGIQKDIGYISYILILVQISALTIIFGFIIMLYPKNNTDVLINKKNILSKIENKKKEKINYKLYIIIFLFLCLLLLLKNIPLILTFDYNSLFIYINKLFYEILTPYPINNNNIPSMENNTTTLLKIISTQMYSELSNIIKFMIITIILLFAIIGLFYLLLPTNMINPINYKDLLDLPYIGYNIFTEKYNLEDMVNKDIEKIEDRIEGKKKE